MIGTGWNEKHVQDKYSYNTLLDYGEKNEKLEIMEHRQGDNSVGVFR